MTRDKVREVLQRYDQELAELGYTCNQFDDDAYNTSFTAHADRVPPAGNSSTNYITLLPRNCLLAHCRWMCREALEKFLSLGASQSDFEKAMRWMCYVQGVTNALGIYSCNDLRDHSRSAKTEFKTPAEEHMQRHPPLTEVHGTETARHTPRPDAWQSPNRNPRHCVIEDAALSVRDGGSDGSYGLLDVAGDPEAVAAKIRQALEDDTLTNVDPTEPLFLTVRVRIEITKPVLENA